MRIILLISFFTTVYLVIFLFFNFRQEDVTILQSRLKKLRLTLLEEYYEHTEELNRSRWRRELEHRREDVLAELKRGLSARVGAAEIDKFIEGSWDDLIAILGSGTGTGSLSPNDEALKTILGRLLPDAAGVPPGVPDTAQAEGAGEPGALDEAAIVEALEGPTERKAYREVPAPELGLEELDAADEPETLEDLAGAEDEAPEAELAELEAPEPEPAGAGDTGPEAAAGEAALEPETLEDPAGAEDEAPEAELAELEAPEPEPAGAGDTGPEAAAGEAALEPETLEDPAGAEDEAPEAEAAELEAPEPEPAGTGDAGSVGEAAETADEPETLEDLAGAEDEAPGAMANFPGIDPLGFEDSDGSEMAINNLVRAIEFSPESRELEREKELAAKSMAEHLEIQSPFASIFSTLSEVEFEPEPMEDLESLEREWLMPDDSPETEAEALQFSFPGFQFSAPFLNALSGEITALAAEDEDAAPEEAEPALPESGEPGDEAPEDADAGGVVTERDGVIYVNERALRPDKETLKGLDRNFKNLIDSILNNS
jgi:hypothetical protein